jgi:hypothetical protein
MAEIKDSIEIRTTAEKAFEGLIKLFSSQEDYKRWHKDHVQCQWLKGKSFEKGSILYVEEYLHGELHKMKFLCTQLEPNNKIEFKILFPMSFICPKGSFIIRPKGESCFFTESKGESCIFTASLTFRFGGLFSKLVKSKVEAMKNHMKEEGENLKKIVEANI